MSQFDYVSNAANGYEAQDVLQNKLLALRLADYLSVVVKTFRVGDPNASNVGQFYAPFMVQFHNGSRWIIFSTTSCRTDRIKGQQWDADNLKRLDPTIDKAILTYPDDVPSCEKKSFIKQKEKYDKGVEISQLDDIVSNEELVSQIKSKAQAIFNEQEEEGQEQILSAKDKGRAYDFGGKAFEKDVATVLSNPTYLMDMKKGAKGTDKKYLCFVKMLEVFGLDASKVKGIAATSRKEDIDCLPSGGSPKTDVWATVSLANGSSKDITISCKRTTQSTVSVHQYTADVFADVLDPNNMELRTLLKVFQFCGNAQDMPQGDRVGLEKQLHPHLLKLCRWVLGGFGMACKSPIQCANYLVVYNPCDGYFATHSVDDYTTLLLNRTPLAFGTPFGWTYASKQRGKSIQLKVPIIQA